MVSSREEAIEELSRRGYHPAIIGIYRGVIPHPLRHEAKPPRAFFDLRSELVKRYPDFADFVPLWEGHNHAVVGVDLRTGEYSRIYLVPPVERYSLGSNFEQFLTHILVEFLESGSVDNAHEMVDLFDYKQRDALESIIEEEDEERAEEKVQKLLASLRA